MNTKSINVTTRRQGLTRSQEFKVQIETACLQVGISTAAIVSKHGLNLNLVYRWISEFEQIQDMNTRAQDGGNLVQIQDP